MRDAVVLVAVLIAALVALTSVSVAQGTFTRPAPSAESSAQTSTSAASPAEQTPARTLAEPGLFDRLSSAIRAEQQRFYRQFSGAIRTLRDGYTVEAAFGLIVVSFLYGVFHAAGPGHGKAVIASYMLANERQLRRGLLLAGLASLAQAVTAVVLVYGLIFVLQASGRRIQAVAGHLETISYAAIIGLGAWMLWRAASPLVVSLRHRLAAENRAPAHAGHSHEHHHHHDGHAHHDHSHDHGHECSQCGHAHMPPPPMLDRPLTIATAMPIILSIGLRPCTGAVVVLVFAHTLGLHLAGVGAAFVMAIGTAITVGLLAALAVGARDTAARLIVPEGAWMSGFYRTVAIAGSTAVLVLGVVLMHGAVTAPMRPFL